MFSSQKRERKKKNAIKVTDGPGKNLKTGLEATCWRENV